MKKVLLLILLSAFGLHVRAQFADLSHPDTFIYNKVYKNIAAYHIKNASYSPFKETSNFFYENFLPDEDASILMDIQQAPLSYPDTAYKLYVIRMNGLTFRHRSGMTLSRSGLHPGNLFLLALNPQTGAVKFISGQFFLSAIADDFGAKTSDPASLLPYLSMRTYADSLSRISYSKRVGDILYYDAWSGSKQKKALIMVDTHNTEQVQVSYPALAPAVKRKPARPKRG